MELPIYVKRIILIEHMAFLHEVQLVQYSIDVSSFPSDLDWFSDDFERTWK